MLLQCMGSRVALVNCVETYTTRLLYEHVLNTLSGDLPSEANLFTGHGRCDTMQDFLTSLTDVIDASEVRARRKYVERPRRWDGERTSIARDHMEA